MIPELAKIFLPLLVSIQAALWPGAPAPHWMAGQVEQETCQSLTSRMCWSPRAELKTSREYGFGLGQITIAYNSDGSERFNNFNEMKRASKDLSGWQWADRYDPERQLIALVVKNRGIFNRVTSAATDQDRVAFTLSAYNGGEGGVRKDRMLCKNTKGCDSSRWFGHTERTSSKAKAAFKGYRKSAFQINREYVRNVLGSRQQKYAPWWGR